MSKLACNYCLPYLPHFLYVYIPHLYYFSCGQCLSLSYLLYTFAFQLAYDCYMLICIIFLIWLMIVINFCLVFYIPWCLSQLMVVICLSASFLLSSLQSLFTPSLSSVYLNVLVYLAYCVFVCFVSLVQLVVDVCLIYFNFFMPLHLSWFMVIICL